MAKLQSQAARLQILKGADEGAEVPLDKDVFTLGRNPDCDYVIPITSVSKKHARIVRVEGRYFIEDTQSRNGTFVNNVAISTRTPLKHTDKVRVCDFVAQFLEPPPAPGTSPPETAEREDEDEGSSTVEAMLSPSSGLTLETQPAEKLRGLLEISASLSKTLELDPLLPKIVDSLFNLFRQADRCFLIQAEEGTNRLLPRVVKTRRPQDETTARFSGSIVRKCLATAQAYLTDDASKDVALSQSVIDFRIRSVMCVPLVGAEGNAFGVIQLDTQDRSKKFTQDDLKLLIGVANQASIAMENARLHEELVRRERKQRDLELAREVQRSFLPRKLPQVAGYEFYAHYESALEVGGDYYGFIPLPQGRLAVALGDVAGKGVPAALLMAKLSSDARFSLLTETDLGRAVRKLNDLLYEFTCQMDRFVTLAAAVLDPAAHAVTLVNAGHLSPLLYRQASGAFEEAVPKELAGVPLGVLEDYPYESHTVSLQPGDSLLLFTDGVTDALDTRNAAFSLHGIQTALAAVAAPSPRNLVERITKAVEQHAAGRDPHDDITLVCLGRTR
jgi:serine phosphatase RsbU (regulator of sigma subunit)/pSer/pThr/pTyr-binding forkhead associated (FHA) protein